MDYSILPKVDRVVDEAKQQLLASGETCYKRTLTDAARDAIDALRKSRRVSDGLTKEGLFDEAISDTLNRYRSRIRPSLRRVINATGVVLHTNLGRAPLAPEAARAAYEVSAGYCNLEMDLESGKRGSRYDHVASLLRDLTGAEDAIAVNNNAAAVLLTLDTLARGGEAIVSRGQLVEIGGSFRIAEVIERSRAVLREVGATNRTHLYDYEGAICEQTSCLLQVHPSNFCMDGFVEEVPTANLATLAHAHDLPLIYDLGSGCLYPFEASGIGREPLPAQLIAAGTDVLTFSGDKLLGGPQAGIIAGRSVYLEKIKKNPLIRALRIDKLTLSALEATLAMYWDGREADIPAVAMITASAEELRSKAVQLRQALEGCAARVSLVEAASPVGGGSLPDVKLPSWVVEITPEQCGADELLHRLLTSEPSVVGYIHEDRAYFDPRTVPQESLSETAQAIKEALQK